MQIIADILKLARKNGHSATFHPEQGIDSPFRTDNHRTPISAAKPLLIDGWRYDLTAARTIAGHKARLTTSRTGTDNPAPAKTDNPPASAKPKQVRSKPLRVGAVFVTPSATWTVINIRRSGAVELFDYATNRPLDTSMRAIRYRLTLDWVRQKD